MRCTFYGLLVMIIIATACVLFTINITYNNIEQRIETLQQQNDSLKQEIVLLNNYLYD
jgi:hypothetical protein